MTSIFNAYGRLLARFTQPRGLPLLSQGFCNALLAGGQPGTEEAVAGPRQ